ncbi:MAG: hypothetical protein AAFR74_00500 [Pseudomonadota bacterium]
MRRQIARLTPFSFESDFSAPDAPAEERGDIVLTADELSALLAETRDSTAQLVRDETLKTHAQDTQKISQELKAALQSVVDLAEHLDTAALAEEDRRIALDQVRRMASTLVEGQADLFTAVDT